MVLDKNNYATTEEVGTWNHSEEETNLATRNTTLGNPIQFQFASGNGVTNNNGSTPDKFCQMPNLNYGWLTNKNPLTGISKIKVNVQQSAAKFRIDFSNTETLEKYYYSATRPSYVEYRSVDYTGSTSYEIPFDGTYCYFRFQNLSEECHLSLTSIEISYSCSASKHRGVLLNSVDDTLFPGSFVVSEGGNITIDYKFADAVKDASVGVSMFLGSDTNNRFGGYKLLVNSLETTYSGVTCEVLTDGYKRLTFDISKLNKVYGTETAPTTINLVMFKWFEVTNGVYFDIQTTPKSTTFTMTGSEFKVLNLTDMHVTDPAQLGSDQVIGKTINYAITNSNPDIIVCPGDFLHSYSLMEDLDALCNYFDSYKIPYFFIFGNHDREALTTAQITQRVNLSKYGYIDLGPTNLDSEGNFTIQIKNSSNTLVHGLILMDTGNKYSISDDSNVEYLDHTKIDGVKYGTFNSKSTYCDGASGGKVWSGIKGTQLDWYEDKVNELNCETTLICHAPINEYVKAFEQYQDAVNKKDTAAIASCAPIGNCSQGEQCCGSVEKLGLFDKILELNSTKNIICGHDHLNDFSLLYQGVRLTYALKVGNGAYWKDDGSRSGYTELTINSSGGTSLSQCYYNPLS